MLLEEKIKYVKFLSYLWTIIFCACVPTHLKYELPGYDLHKKVYITAHIEVFPGYLSFFEEIPSLSHSIVFLYFFALFT